MRDGARDLKPVAAATRGAAATVATLLVACAVLAASATGAQFGLSSLSGTTSTSQAGSHPDISTSFALATDAVGNPIGQLRNAAVTLPAGMVGNPQAAEKCAQSAFQQFACSTQSQVGVMELSLIVCQGASASLTNGAEAGETIIDVPNTAKFCPFETGSSITIGSGATAETATIGYVASATQLVLSTPLLHSHAAGETVVHVAESTTVPISLFNLQPMPGHAASFGASLLFIPIFVQADVEGDGQLQITLTNISRLITVQAAKLTLWGVPADPSHDTQRCDQFPAEKCGPSRAAPRPFTTYPTTCDGGALEAQARIESWVGESASDAAPLPSPTGCEKLKIAPALSVQPETVQRDTPSGYEIDVTAPQESEASELGTPPLRDVTVTLPEGTSLSPAVGVGLQACSDALFAQDACPDASKVGAVEVRTPLLSEPVIGAVYIGSPTATEKYRLFVGAGTAALDIHIVGSAQPDAATGRLTVRFENMPQLSFSELKLDLFGGANAALANPADCGPANSAAQFASYAGQTATSSSTFTVRDSGEDGGCPPGAAFSPGFTAGTLSPVAGSSSPFVLRITRSDGQPQISGFSATLPPGLVGMIGSVAPCAEEQAASGSCSSASQVGTVTIAAGAGAQPLYISGPVYLTGSYDSAPFGLAAVVDAKVGPFDLGTVVVRSRITVNPSDLAFTVDTSSLPQVVGGLPLRLRMIDVTLDRPGFMVNPSNCEPRTITARVSSTEGTSADVSEHFQLAGCNGLRFTPQLTAMMPARAGRTGDGAGLDIEIVEPAGSDGALRSAVIQLPRQLRPRLTTIQGACLASTLLATASCPVGSIVGQATVDTRALPSPLAGAVYLVAHGGTERLSLMLMLDGDGIATHLEAEVHIFHNGVIKAAFRDLPPVLISSMRIELFRGPHSLLGAITTPCSTGACTPLRIDRPRRCRDRAYGADRRCGLSSAGQGKACRAKEDGSTTASRRLRSR